jgi:hypothetical protein
VVQQRPEKVPDPFYPYIFCNRHVTPVDCKVVTAGVFGSLGPEQSDHLAVFGTVTIGPMGKEQ